MNINTLKPESAFHAFDLNSFEVHKVMDSHEKRFLIKDLYSDESTAIENSFRTFNELQSHLGLLLQKFNQTDNTFETLDVICFQSPKYLIYVLVNNTYLNFNTYIYI